MKAHTSLKRNDIYYLVYSDISREDKPSCIGYATSKNIMGPFQYQGVIIDNDGCNPGNWNNHGSIAEFNGNWYVFYHRSSHACKTMRKTCIEPIFFDGEGKIKEVEMTTQGVSPPLNPKSKIEAEYACLLHGNVRIEQVSQENEILTKFNRSDAAIYKYIDFSIDVSKINLMVSVREDCKILVSAGKPWEKRLALIDVKKDDYKDNNIITNSINNIEGVHSLWIQVYSDYDNPIDIDNFYFE
jgi:arabinoxylan arabinofuranohydrolase